MGYSQDNGYTPTTIETIMLSIMNEINTQFSTSYTQETFAGTNFYKNFYAAAQEMQKNEVKTSEIFLKLQQYITETNQSISRPVTTNPGVLEKLASEGYIASVKPMIDADAGKSSICIDVFEGVQAEGTATITNYANLVTGTPDSITVAGVAFTAQGSAATLGTATFQAATSNNATAASLAIQINAHATTSPLVQAYTVGAIVHFVAKKGGTDGNALTLAYTNNDANVGATVSGATLSGGTADPDYAAKKSALCLLISQCIVAGVVTQGTESQAIVLSNGQSFDFKYYLPNRLKTSLRLTITTSENNQTIISNPDDIKLKLIDNIEAIYKLGKNFEPQRYFSTVDAPWASNVLLEYSLNGGATWLSAVYDAAYNDLLVVSLADITLIED